MKKTKFLSLLLVILMLATLLAACDGGAQTSPSPSGSNVVEDSPGGVPETNVESPPPFVAPSNFNTKTPADTLVVGTPAIAGDFIDGWGNSSYDQHIKVLTGGFYSTYYQSPEGQLLLNPTVVQDVATSYDDDGNKTYTFTLYEDLYWNNGDQITAQDYIAFIMFYSGPQITEQGGSYSYGGPGIVGYSEFKAGETEIFAGVQLVDEFVFSMTIDAIELPFFWETSYVMVRPINKEVYFPGVEIISDENGIRFDTDVYDLVANIASEERYAPTITCGPYIFISFDGTTVNLQRNPYFKSDQLGYKPTFEYIIQMEVPSETDVDLVLSGDIDLNTGNIEGSKIEKALASEYAVAHSYLRPGFGFIGFTCDWSPTKDANVRWAIAYMIDRNAIIDHVLEGYGGLVDASYGMAQWTYQSRRREIAESLTQIAFNLEKANEHLDQTEWVFEEDGVTPFDSSLANSDGTYMRHNSDGEALVIRHYSASSVVGGAIEAEAIKNAPLIGMVYEVTHGDFDTLTNHFYYGYSMPDSERVYSAFNLATNFTAVDDKYWYFHSDQLGTWQNSNQIGDDELDEIIVAMRSLDPTQTDEHADLWLAYQIRWQQLLPSLPLYSNQYFDIFNSVVTQVPTTPYANWEDVICQISKFPNS
ncbi:MAG: ABC transporter substrate-binding protein [Oscillospiraceae bacterium]|nr:ABC transporter substrate-binding protein [Oscillospiraceae bacterium]